MTSPQRIAIQIVDLGFGDSGKGTMIDYLARRHSADLVVRFNGGPQAGHNVVLPDGRHHTFSQFASSGFIRSVPTLLSRFMLIEPYAMLNEAEHLHTLGVADILPRTLIDERCLVITPIQQIANRIRERARGNSAHGTCGLGIGECVADFIEQPELAICAGELNRPDIIGRKLRDTWDLKRAALTDLRPHAAADELCVLDDPSWIDVAITTYAEVFDRATIVQAYQANEKLRESKCVLFEGAQGVLLDERYGFHPHTTWSRTTFTNADLLLEEAVADHESVRIGVTRTYATRHGIGPFVTQDESLANRCPEPHNSDTGRQGPFRRGVLDIVMLRYALTACGGVDGVAITHLDRLDHLPPKICDGYEIDGLTIRTLPCSDQIHEAERLTQRLQRARPLYRVIDGFDEPGFLRCIEESVRTTVKYRSRGPTWKDKD